MRATFAALGYGVGSLVVALVALIAIACSAAINGHFAFTRLGGELVDLTNLTAASAAIIAVAGLVAFDLLKACLPLLCRRAYRHQQYAYVAIGSIIFLGSVALSLSASFGFFLEQRADVTSERQVAHARLAAIATQIAETRARLASHPSARPVATIKAELAAQAQHYRWDSTKGCTDATAVESRAFCTAYHELEAELGHAQMVAADRATLATLLAQQENVRAAGLKPTDPQLETLARVSGWEPGTVGAIMYGVVAVMLELVSAFGLLLAVGHGPKPPPPPAAPAVPAELAPVASLVPGKRRPVTTVVATEPTLLPAANTDTNRAVELMEELRQYGVARLEHTPGATITLTELYADYRRWCAEGMRPPLRQRDFTATLKSIAAHIDEIAIGTRSRRQVLLNMQFRQQVEAA
ncbi:MAG: hypothetical protein AB7U75_17340 [Hyphomicrobiaceae bacterium]